MTGSDSARPYDLVAVGSGAGGLAAAATVAELGGRALVLEKDEQFGGVTGLSVGQIWIGATSVAAEAGIRDSIEETLSYLDFISAGLGDRELRRHYVESGSRAIDFLRDRVGIKFFVIRDYPDYWYPKAVGSKPEGRYLEVEPFKRDLLGPLKDAFISNNPFGTDLVSTPDLVEAGGNPDKRAAAAARHYAAGELCGGAALSASLLAAGSARGAEFRAQSRVTRLLTEAEGGGVTGVEVLANGQRSRIACRSVLLATGGYDWNLDYVKTFEHLPRLESQAPTTIEGDHLTMAIALGAAVASARPESTPRNLGLNIPGRVRADGTPLFQGIPGMRPGGIIVNAAGQRFADESFYPDLNGAYVTFDAGEQCFPNQPAWMIFDQEYLENYGLQTVKPGQPMPEGLGHVAEDLLTLAKLAGIDPDGLVGTVERFNKFSAQGFDEDFGRGTVPWSRLFVGDARVKPNPLLGPLGAGPYYAIELRPVGASIATAGLKVDAVGRVLTPAGGVIPGLYAAGNAAARSDIAGYQSGVANMKGLQLGYLSALDIMSEPPTDD